MDKYDKNTYWNKRKDPNSNESKKNVSKQIAWLKKYLSKDDYLLDYGPGVGRLSEIYKIVKSVSFYDITDNYKSKILNICKENNIEFKNFIVNDTKEIKTNFKNFEFDVILCSEVLLHVSEDEILDLMLELSRIGKKVIVNTWYKNGETISLNHCFTRDYKKIINDNNLILIHWEEKAFDNQLCFIYQTKKNN